MQQSALKIEVEIPFDKLYALIERLPTEQKRMLLERLNMLAFKENWLELSQRIVSPGFSEEEIAAEIKASRNN